MRALDAALGVAWAMEQRALEDLLAIAARENETTPEALERYRAATVARGETLERRGNVAILSAVGPMFRRANLFTALSGATSYEIMARDLTVALDDPEIRAIMLNIDSPGGDANGVGELAKMVFEARGSKPIKAYVGGAGMSAAYWLTAAASEVIVDDMAMLGSVGVVMSVKDTTARDAAAGIRTYEIVSSQSPAKRADPSTDEGRGRYQRVADDLAEVFIGAVARYRGVSNNDVIAGFGQGGTMVGAKAVEAGMADRIGTFEETIKELQDGRSPGRRTQRSAAGRSNPAAASAAPTGHTEVSMTDNPSADDQAAAIKTARAEAAAEAVKADRERRQAIMALDEAKGREALAEHLYATTEMSAEQIKATLAAAPKTGESPAEDYERARLVGAGLGGPAKSAPAAAADGWKAAAAKINARH